MPLIDSAIRALKPREKPYKVADEKSLYLLVSPSGGRLWKVKFRAAGASEKKLSLGSYPDISLKEARDYRDEARSLKAKGIGSAEKKRRDRHVAKVNAANTFGAIASAYIADRMGEFQGSYVLGTAGYNAGPGRARQWMREYGDPRDPKVDVVDWIYRIPFEETREYVQKVLANTQIYRARLGTSETALRLNDDLARARGANRAADRVTADVPGELTPKAGSSDEAPPSKSDP